MSWQTQGWLAVLSALAVFFVLATLRPRDEAENTDDERVGFAVLAALFVGAIVVVAL